MNQKIEKVMSEWEPLKVEYALPNSTVPIADLWTVAYDMSEIIKELAEREAKLIESLKEITSHFSDVMGGPMIAGSGIVFANGIDGIPTIKKAKTILSELGVK